MNSITKKDFFSFKYFIIQILCLGASTLNTNIAAVIAGLWLVWMVKGPLQIMQALTIIVIIKNLNPALVQHSVAIGLVGWAVVLICGVRAIFLFNNQAKNLYLALSFFCVLVAFITPLNSPYLSISFLKIFSFFWFVSAVVLCAYSMNRNEVYQYQRWLFTFCFVIVLMSIPLYFFPTIGFFRNGTGFQGITSHPQIFGPMLVPILAWILVQLFMTKSKFSISLLLISTVLIILVYMSEARTALVALGLSLIATYLVSIFSRHRLDFNLAKSTLLGLFGIVVLLVLVTVSTGVNDLITSFVYKHGGESITDAYEQSRGGGISSHLYYFKKSPLIGNGFGVYPDGHFNIDPVYIGGFPISAPVEKGFLPTMILEEIGIVGMMGFLIFWFSLTKEIVKNNDNRWLAMYFACFFINVGEAVFFAVNGISQWYWGLIILALSQRFARR